MSSQIVIVGRCVKIERKEIAGGNVLVSVRVPVDYKSKGESETTWWDVNLWNNTAEAFMRYNKEMDVVMFSGQPHVREYERSDGTKGFSPTVKSASWTFIPRSRSDPRESTPALPNTESGFPF